MIYILILLFTIVFIVEQFWKPRLDYTKNKWVILWYNDKMDNRKFIKLF